MTRVHQQHSLPGLHEKQRDPKHTIFFKGSRSIGVLAIRVLLYATTTESHLCVNDAICCDFLNVLWSNRQKYDDMLRKSVFFLKVSFF